MVENKNRDQMIEPIITIIICTYNRAKILEECLKAICNQTQTQDYYKILVIDNNSTDETYEIVNSFVTTYSNIRYVLESTQGLSYARNRGTSEADTEWVAFLDDDGLAHENFVEVALQVINNYNFDCFGGIYYPWYKYGKPHWLNQDFGRKIPLSNTTIEIDEPKLDGGIFAIKKNVLESIGGFSTELGMTGNKIAYGEETLLQIKLLEAGYKLGFSPEWQMDHLVAKYKLSVLWHLNAEYAKGRDSMLLESKLPVKWSHFDKIKFVCFYLLKGMLKSFKKLTMADYYLQNAIIDTLGPIYFRFGQQSIKKSE